MDKELDGLLDSWIKKCAIHFENVQDDTVDFLENLEDEDVSMEDREFVEELINRIDEREGLEGDIKDAMRQMVGGLHMIALSEKEEELADKEEEKEHRVRIYG